MTLKSAYKGKCKRLNIKPNSRLLSMLPDEESACSELTKLDLSDNIIGPQGALAVLEVVREASKLSMLCLKGNNITSKPMKEVCDVLKGHETIETIDLSQNDIRLAGPELVELVKHNTNIKTLDISETNLRPLFANLISMQLKKNGSKKVNESKTEPKKTEVAEIPQENQLEQPSRDDSKPSTAKSVGFGEAVVAEFGCFDDGEEVSFNKGDTKEDNEDDEGLERYESFTAFGRDNQSSPTKYTPPSTSQTPLKKVAARRPTVCAEAYSEEQIDNFKPVVNKKESAVKDFLLVVLEKNQLFNHLDDYELMIVVDALTEIQRTKGDTIIEQGDEEMDSFYIIGHGEVSLRVDGIEVKTLTRGDTFGDIFLLYPQNSPETVFAEEECTLYAFGRKTFKFILNQASKKKRATYEGILCKVPFLSTLSHLELLQLADALKSSQYNDGDHVINYGEEGKWLHIVLEGTLSVIGRNEDGERIKVCEFTNGACVGELEFLNNHETVADVVASGKVRTAKMNRRHFEMCMGPVIEILRKNADKLEVYSYYRDTLAKIKE